MSDEVKPATPINCLTRGKHIGLGVDLAQTWRHSSRLSVSMGWVLALVEFYRLSIRSGRQSKTCHFKPDIIFISWVMQVIDKLTALHLLRLLPRLKGLSMITFVASIVDFEQQRRYTDYPRFFPDVGGETALLEKLHRHPTLQWVDQEREGYKISFSQNLGFKQQQLSVALPAAEIPTLFAPAIVGDARAIVERAARLKVIDQQRLPVAAPLRQLAQGFKKHPILKFLK